MSADNSIVIMKTPVANQRQANRFEYRVELIGSGFWVANDLSNHFSGYYPKTLTDLGIELDWLGDTARNFLLKSWYPSFKKSPVFTTLEEASDYADEMQDKIEDDGGYVEYDQTHMSFPLPFQA